MADPAVSKAIHTTLTGLVEQLDAHERDEFDVIASDGKVDIAFESGLRFIVNRQGAADQIWLAEPRGGWHFDLREGRWIDDKRGVELFEELSRLLTAQLGEEFRLEAC
ncbi:MAG: iron donor protein CyaY [Planctomycetes bacterium]|nr:iron donor protein CyaY [Planctomycetota bacterium]